MMAALVFTALAGLEGLNPPPEGFVDLREAVPGARFDIRYHTPHNFTGTALPGYGAPGAWLRAEPARSLAAVQADLVGQGFGLLVFDAYRPLRGTLAMVAWAERSGNTHLLDQGYVARRSNHNRGTTIDLTLVRLATGEEVDMGTPWDTLDARAHTANAQGEVALHRRTLVEAMRRQGFVNYSKEWWHFTWRPEESPPPRDVPYGCREPAEGGWKAPSGWSTPGWSPEAVLTGPCPDLPGVP